MPGSDHPITASNPVRANDIHAMPATDTHGMFRLYQTYLRQELDATTVSWMAAYQGAYGREWWQTEMMDGWKIVDLILALEMDVIPEETRKAYFKQAQSTGMDPQAALTIKESGTTRVRRIGDAISDEDWQDHWMRPKLLEQNVGERMVGTYTLDAECESHVLVDRPPDASPFTEEDAETFFRALLDFPRIHYWLMLERGLTAPAERPFSPRECQMVQHLLGPLSEKEIADAMEISKSTAHSYVVDLYRNLGVSSRYQMLQLWLSRAPTAATKRLEE